MTRTSVGLAFGAAIALALAAPAAAQDKTDSGQKSGEKRFSFTMENQPWNKVLEWLVDQTGLPLVSPQAPPAGNFTFVSPKGAQARTYTLTEVIDYINTGLMAKGLILLRRE